MSASVPAAFGSAWAVGDAASMMALLDVDAVLVCDTGGVVEGPLEPINGAARIAEWMLARFAPDAHRFVLATANSRPAFRIERREEVVGKLVMRPDESLLTMLWLTLNPEKLGSGSHGGVDR